MNYRIEIDGIRAFAVLAVIFNHINKEFLPSGYLGVDVFFVISGYVITNSLSKNKSLNFWDFIINFYEKRIKRLIPALILFIITFCLLISIFSPTPHNQLGTGFTSLFGVSNIYTYLKQVDYFAPSTLLNPFTHTWSLGVEEQFYFIFPLIIWFSGFTRKSSSILLKLILIALSTISLFSFIYFYPTNFEASYYLMPNRFWEISLGSLVFLFFKSKGFLINYLRKIPCLFLFLTLVIIMFLPIKYGLLGTIFSVLITSLLLLNLNPKSNLYPILTNKYIVHIGLISYSLYLWHWGILSISRWTLGIFWWSIPFQLLLIFICSEFSYRFIEQKFRKINLLTNKYINLCLGLISIIVSALFILFLKNLNIYSGKSIAYGVNASLPERYFIKSNKNPTSKSILVIGDSHAGALYPMMDKISSEENLSIFLHDRLYGIEKYNFRDTKYCIDNNNCPEFNYFKPILDIYKSNLKEDDLVYISLGFPHNRKINLEQKKNINYVINYAKENNLNVVLQTIVPFYRQSVHALCSSEWFRPSKFISNECSQVTRISLKKELNDINEYYSSLVKSNSHVFLFDAFEFFCPSQTKYCSPSIDNKFINWDSNHLSIFGSKLLSDEFKLFLFKNKLLEK